jgi:hypothetical protein
MQSILRARKLAKIKQQRRERDAVSRWAKNKQEEARRDQQWVEIRQKIFEIELKEAVYLRRERARLAKMNRRRALCKTKQNRKKRMSL